MQVLSHLGYPGFFFGADCDVTEQAFSYIVPEAHFQHPDIQDIYQVSFSSPVRPIEITKRIQRLKDHLAAFSQTFT